MRVSCSMPVGTSVNQYALVAARVALCSASLEDVATRTIQAGDKEVWTMSTLSAPDCLVQRPDWPGFRMFPRDSSNDKAGNRVRVPPRAQHDPSSEEFLPQRVDMAWGCVHLTLTAGCAWRRGLPVW